MRATRTTESNFTFTGPIAEIADLPGRVDVEDNRFTAYYELTDAERTMIGNGAGIRVGIGQLPIPPMSIEVIKLEEAPGLMENGVPVKPDYRCSGCDALYTADRAIDELKLVCGRSWCDGELRLPGAAE